MNTSQRSARGLSSASQRRMAQNTSAVKKDDMAYTSLSTAENQNESEKQYAIEPTRPVPMMAHMRPSVSSCPIARMSLRPSRVSDQNMKRMVPALARADMVLSREATVAGLLANREKRRPMSMKVGAPGG